MNQVIAISGLAFGLFLLAGCNDFSTPTSAAESAYGDLMSSDVAGFKKALSGSALKQYGSSDAAAALRQKLQGLKNVKVGRVQLVSTAQTGQYSWSDLYTLNVLASGHQVVLRLTSICTNSPSPSCAHYDPQGNCEADPTTIACTVDSIQSSSL